MAKRRRRRLTARVRAALEQATAGRPRAAPANDQQAGARLLHDLHPRLAEHLERNPDRPLPGPAPFLED